jgi:hypothetical protein
VIFNLKLRARSEVEAFLETFESNCSGTKPAESKDSMEIKDLTQALYIEAVRQIDVSTWPPF